MIVFIDDCKPIYWYGLTEKDKVEIFKEADAGLAFCLTHDVETLYLDHDLGEGLTGYDILLHMVEAEKKPKKVICISLNPVGTQHIKLLCERQEIEYQYEYVPKWVIMIDEQLGK